MTVDLSADTARLSSTPAPLGRPGGPGLWHTKGLKLPNYIEQIATGIMHGGVPDKSRAIALAIGAVKRWASGRGKVSPEVRAAAAKALAEWSALKAAHSGGSSHANDDVGAVSLAWNGVEGIDLAAVRVRRVLPAAACSGGWPDRRPVRDEQRWDSRENPGRPAQAASGAHGASETAGGAG